MILTTNSVSDIPSYLLQQVPGADKLPRFHVTDTEAIAQHLSRYLQQQVPRINGLVLCGGQSTRMGQDKGSLQYHDKSQRRFVFDLLSPYCSQTFISCNGEQSKNMADIPNIEDSFLQLGPLGGILSAFQKSPDSAWLTVACDLPFLGHNTVSYLVAHRNPSKMATAFWDAEGKFPEPLVTLWEPKAYPVLLQFLSQGYSCPRKALIHSNVEMLYAPDAFAFTNVNTTEEYHKAMSRLHKQA